MPHDTTTVRVSRRTHRLLGDLAAAEGRSVADYLDRLTERARRQQILDQYNARMGEVLSEPAESTSLHVLGQPEEAANWREELALSEASAAEAMADEPAYPLS